MNTINTQIAADVLRATEHQPSEFFPNNVAAFEIAEGSELALLVSAAADKLRRIAANGVCTRYRSRDAYYADCAYSLAIAYDIADTLKTQGEAAIILAIFDRAGWFGFKNRPLTTAATAQIQSFASEIIGKIKFLFSTQTELSV